MRRTRRLQRICRTLPTLILPPTLIYSTGEEVSLYRGGGLSLPGRRTCSIPGRRSISTEEEASLYSYMNQGSLWIIMGSNQGQQCLRGWPLSHCGPAFGTSLLGGFYALPPPLTHPSIRGKGEWRTLITISSKQQLERKEKKAWSLVKLLGRFFRVFIFQIK